MERERGLARGGGRRGREPRRAEVGDRRARRGERSGHAAALGVEPDREKHGDAEAEAAACEEEGGSLHRRRHEGGPASVAHGRPERTLGDLDHCRTIRRPRDVPAEHA